MHQKVAATAEGGISLQSGADAVQKGSSVGLWCCERDTGMLQLSTPAAELLGVASGGSGTLEDFLLNVVDEDRESARLAFRRRMEGATETAASFRVSTRSSGTRWLRLAGLPEDRLGPSFACGFLADITAVKMAEKREQFIFRFTQLLVGTHTVEEVIDRILPMVCMHLGWEWGAFWGPPPGHDADDGNGVEEAVDLLYCRQVWHEPMPEMEHFAQVSRDCTMSPGEGLVGAVWCGGQATWIEDMPNHPAFLRREGAQRAGLESGYAFPVVHVGTNGVQQRFGVLEFFSKYPRQPSAQLPLVAAAVGALIAQTVQRLEQEAEIRRMAQTDEMTGLVNRSHFHALLEQACREGEGRQSFGLLYIDLDRFKPINDAFGHEAGNVVLKEFASRLQALMPPRAVAGRLGGDEFAVLLHADDIVSAAGTLGEQILRAARTPVLFHDWPLMVTGSIGVARYPLDGKSAPELLRNADAAMYDSKRSGRNSISFGETRAAQMPGQGKTSLIRQMAIASELQRALARDEFFLEYQPIVEAASGRVVALEALVRWQRASGEVLYPGQFIHVAEDCGLVADIDRWVVRRALSELAESLRAMPELRVTVNMAAPDFTFPALPAELLTITGRHGVQPSQLCLELTERMTMHQPDKVIGVMQELRGHGFRISLDDFGTEHSSLARLKNLPITSLKVDRSFVKGLPDQVHDRAIVRAMLEMAREMDLAVVVEGVEEPRQLEALRQFGNPLVQGYLLGRPARLAVAVGLLERESDRAYST